MAKIRKLWKKILGGSKNIRFDDFISIVLAFGFTQVRIEGSHHIFKHPDLVQAISIQPTTNGQAKPYQVKKFIKLVEKYDLQIDGQEEET